jgi:hypothetical protein
MVSRLAVLLFLMLPISSFGADVFRCPDEDGIRFTDQPCPDGERLDIDPHPGSGGAGLRPGERELLERLDRRDLLTPPPSPPAAPTDLGGCSGIRVLAMEPYSVQVTVVDWIAGYPYRRRIERQCARFELRLERYFGRLRDTVAEDLERRLFARLAGGSTVAVESLALEQAPNRFGIRETVTGRACFGAPGTPVQQLGCR